MLDEILNNLNQLGSDMRKKVDELEIERVQIEMQRQENLKDLQALDTIVKSLKKFSEDSKKFVVPENPGGCA